MAQLVEHPWGDQIGSISSRRTSRPNFRFAHASRVSVTCKTRDIAEGNKKKDRCSCDPSLISMYFQSQQELVVLGKSMVVRLSFPINHQPQDANNYFIDIHGWES